MEMSITHNGNSRAENEKSDNARPNENESSGPPQSRPTRKAAETACSRIRDIATESSETP